MECLQGSRRDLECFRGQFDCEFGKLSRIEKKKKKKRKKGKKKGKATRLQSFRILVSVVSALVLVSSQ